LRFVRIPQSSDYIRSKCLSGEPLWRCQTGNGSCAPAHQRLDGCLEFSFRNDRVRREVQNRPVCSTIPSNRGYGVADCSRYGSEPLRQSLLWPKRPRLRKRRHFRWLPAIENVRNRQGNIPGKGVSGLEGVRFCSITDENDP
jgi:hypothetical protein